MNNWVQVWDVQSGWWLTNRSIRGSGRKAENGQASGTLRKNEAWLLCDTASAFSFWGPGRYWQCNSIQNLAVMTNKQCRRCITWGSRLYPELTTATTAWLAQKILIVQSCHYWKQLFLCDRFLLVCFAPFVLQPKCAPHCTTLHTLPTPWGICRDYIVRRF